MDQDEQEITPDAVGDLTATLKGDASEAPAPAVEAEPSTLQGTAFPTIRVHTNAGVRGLPYGVDAEVPDDDETQALIASGHLVRL